MANLQYIAKFPHGLEEMIRSVRTRPVQIPVPVNCPSNMFFLSFFLKIVGNATTPEFNGSKEETKVREKIFV